MSVIRNEQWLGRYNSGYATGHHHVLWLLNGHHVRGGLADVEPAAAMRAYLLVESFEFWEGTCLHHFAS